MILLTLTDVSLAFGHQPLLHRANLQIERGERVCLLGRNGTGKSSLFRLLQGAVDADEGSTWRKESIRIACLEQDVPANQPGTVFDLVAGGLGALGALLREYHSLLLAGQEKNAARLTQLENEIDHCEGWNLNNKVETVLSRLSLPADTPFAACSGGIRRRIMLARALASDPDLLLLDEPTNHLDIASITWLEDFLLGFRGTLMFITHDRALLQNLATRIVELDRGKLTSFPGSYASYLRKKRLLLDAEDRARQKFDSKLDDYETWLRQGIKARRTRNEGRVKELKRMRLERQQRREQESTVNLRLDSGAISGKLVAELRNVSFSYTKVPIIREFSTTILRGDRIGIIGPNGSGKSTLIRLLLGELAPSGGEILRGTNLDTAYFDQQRSQLNEEKTVRENISSGSDFIRIAGRSLHVVSYMRDFLFPPERINSPVKSLSGGERNRLLLARLFTSPANVLVLDEPTNDLDLETLELLEDLLASFPGTLLLVSHDRAFLDRVVSSTMVFEGDARVNEYVGGYEDWARQASTRNTPSTAGIKSPTPAQRKKKNRGNKLAYREKQEMEDLPPRIEKLELEQEKIERQVGDADFYRQEKQAITTVLSRLDSLKHELETCYRRWQELEQKQGSK